jgi:response regulator RpfG family c-di-GMP phosphodiesterase
MGLFDRRERTAAARRPPRYGVLLVDDEILNLTSLAALLEDDYRVHVASTPADALKLLEDPALAAGIHVILSDQRMPGMTGVELLARSRQLKPDAKRLLLTGYTDIEAIVEAINDAAIYKYLRKPIDGQELRLTLARACESWQLETDNAALVLELQQAFTRLQLLDADKMAFLRYLAQEMNTPLNWLAAAQVIDREELTEEGREMLACIDQGRERLHGLVGAVLRYFQAAGLELQAQTGLLDLTVVLDELAAALRDKGGGQLTVRLEQPVTLLMESDAQLVRETLAHLLENAATHALRGHDGQAEVAVRVALQERHVLIGVSSSGAKPAPEALAALFRPFFFFGAAHGAQGYGLSLATARALAVALGGELQAACQAETPGLCLQLRLPLALPARPA